MGIQNLFSDEEFILKTSFSHAISNKSGNNIFVSLLLLLSYILPKMFLHGTLAGMLGAASASLSTT